MSALASKIRDANVQIVEHGNIEDIADFFSADYVVYMGGSTRSGHGAVRGFTNTLHSAFSELSVDVKILIESDDRITWQRTTRGTQTGTFQGFPASGVEITWRDMVVSRIEDDRIKEEWVVTDWAEAMLRSRKH